MTSRLDRVWLLVLVAGGVLQSGCAHISQACESVAEAEAAATRALEELETRGVVGACQAGNTDSCNIVRTALDSYDHVLEAYKVCYDG